MASDQKIERLREGVYFVRDLAASLETMTKTLENSQTPATKIDDVRALIVSTVKDATELAKQLVGELKKALESVN